MMKILVLCTLFVNYVSDTNARGRGDFERFALIKHSLFSRYIKCDHDKDSNLDVSLANVNFFDFSNDMVEVFPILEAANTILKLPTINITRHFFIFVPSYKSKMVKKTERQITETFTDFPNSYLIIIDYSIYTNDIRSPLNAYERSVQYAYYIGRALGEMLAELHSGGVSAQSIHCIGHSVGGQILGYTGQIFIDLTGTKLWRITALDPAGPCFSNSFNEDQVRSGVADYVEVYHCNVGGLSSSSVLADIDFFLNKHGASKLNSSTTLTPGNDSKTTKCRKKTCVTVWTVTVKRPNLFRAWKCDSFKAFTKNKCSEKEVTVAGFWNPGNATGVFYFSAEGFV